MIYTAEEKDVLNISKLAVNMWKSHSVDELSKEFEKIIKSDKAVVFICVENNKCIGFVQCQLRYDYVEGTKSSPVGYLEGIFVDENYRGCGYAKQLLLKCEKWAVSKGCIEFASDCEINNNGSLNFHIKNGFSEVNRIICFSKRL